ncbi:cobaltochelatase subunit CobN [Rhizobium sp. TH2]|uniref:cobaltochelatase subunit CobN n=1 Tax=Rhizobium sp. TH2 TaxID=2775403 RepID=UPI0021574781|nr:cobaltochelatase subunit CobN [Rhizobium sp. TH2]UVC11573.1 cobaltochelatase subunit CobN [Rhizobium sp. TH2]
MHLLLAQKGSISEGDEAFDLGQSPGDILFLSAADTEIASVAAFANKAGPRWRLVNLASLKHPMSIDMWIDKTARHAKLVVLRALGGVSYFSYLIEALTAASKAHGFKFAALPGDDRPDAGLDPWSTVAGEDCARLWSYLVEGGETNMARFAGMAEALVSGGDRPEVAETLAKAGIWWPGRGVIYADEWERVVSKQRSLAVVTFYRALVQSGQTQPVEALIEALTARGLRVLPIFVSSLKDTFSANTIRELFRRFSPDVVLNSTSFAVVSPGAEKSGTVLDETGAQVLQVIFSGSTKESWEGSSMGLSARDLAMNVALPEVDGRVLARAVSFKRAASFDEQAQVNIVTPEALPDRVDFVADLAVAWARLRHLESADKRVALILANYPNRDGRLGNGVGLDTPAGSVEVLKAMREAGYVTGELPADGDALIAHLMAGPTNAATDGRVIRETFSLSHYKTFFATLPALIQDEVTGRWGAPESDPFFLDGAFALPLARFGNVMTGIQPARGYNIDPKETYHSADLVPPHGYLAFYAFLRREFRADAVIHMGKHGNMEWLPGKAMALSETCYPEAVFGPTPHLYPFIVNDPGEGTQAKRRSSAVIIDHLTPPLTRAESYGYLKDLEALVDEYYQAQGTDPRRLRLLKKQILDLAGDTGLGQDVGISGLDEDMALQKLDAWLCDLKEMQIRDGLHVFGVSPEGRLLTDLTVALARSPRGSGEGAGQSLQRAIAGDLLGGYTFDPLDCEMATPWTGPKPDILAGLFDGLWRTNADTVERIEMLAAKLVSSDIACPDDWRQTQLVMNEIETRLKPSIVACGPAEIDALMTGLSGRFVAPGPSGAPTRGRPDVLPTGRNFYSVDTRSVPTPTAWELGRKSAELLVTRYVQDHGDWPTSMGITAWGTSNMRTGGDDIAQALALIGAKPVWDMGSARVTGYEIIPMAVLGRPRVDVTLRISGFFRDAFPEQIALFDRAVRAIGALDEDEADNPIAARMVREAETSGTRQAGHRVFGSKPGTYGAGLQALMDENLWDDRAELAESFLDWGGYAYGTQEEGEAARTLFAERMKTIQAVVQNQDNREHDLLDSDDYYQFEGGMAAAAEHLSGSRPAIYHNDHSRPEKPVVRSLDEEISRVMRGRVVNPKWIAGVMRHGYKGAAEIAATVDFMFAFAATTGAVKDHHFEAAYRAFLMDDTVRDFIEEKNEAALRDIAKRFLDAIDRGMWKPKSNSARFGLAEMAAMGVENAR